MIEKAASEILDARRS